MAIDMENHPYGPGSHAPLADKREMPACYPIKGNGKSKKFHRPDSQGYGQTIAEVWFDSPSAAEAAGFSLAGGHPDGARNEDYEPGGSGHPCTVEAVNANRAATGGGATTVTTGSATVDGAAGQAGISTEISGAGTGGISGKAAAAGAAGVAGAAGLAGAASGKLSGAADLTGNIDVPDVNVPDVNVPDVNVPDVNVPDVNVPDVNVPDVNISAPNVDMPDVGMPDVKGGISGKTGAIGAAGVAGAAGLAGAAGGKLSGAGDIAGGAAGKVTGAAGNVGGKATGALSGAKGAATGGVGKATAAAGVGTAAVGGSVRNDLNYDGDDDDGAGLMGCLRKWWWLLAALLGVLLLGLLLSQCGGDDDGDAAVTASTEAPVVTEAPEVTEAPVVTEAEVEEATTTTEAPATTTTTEAPAEEEPANLAAVAQGQSPTVYGLLGPLGLGAALGADGPMTVFLPSDDGATRVVAENPDLVTQVSADPVAAAAILGYHVVPGIFTSEDLAGGATLVTSTGLELTVADGAVNGIQIVNVDLEGTNGVIHIIDGILTPPVSPQLAVTGTATELAGALGGAFLVLGSTMVYVSRRREDEELAA